MRVTNKEALEALDQFFADNPQLNLGMKDFVEGEVYHSESRLVDCGTSACMVGWAPNAGLTEHLGKAWTQYSYFTFFNDPVLDNGGFMNGPQERLWLFLFSELWPDSIMEARKRLQYVIEHDSFPVFILSGDWDEDGEPFEWPHE